MLRRIRRVLEEKRDVLLLYIRQTAEEYRRSYERVAKLLQEVYREFFVAATATGVEKLRSIAETIPETLRLDVEERVMFAVRTPVLSIKAETLPPLPQAPVRLTSGIVEARHKLLEALDALVKVVETETALRRLLDELRETQRLINALDYSIIPRYESAIKYIRLVLDDRMREDIMRLKMLKRRLEQRRAAGGG
jgi:V/A-type H+-transporting ATPase subunit D